MFELEPKDWSLFRAPVILLWSASKNWYYPFIDWWHPLLYASTYACGRTGATAAHITGVRCSTTMSPFSSLPTVPILTKLPSGISTSRISGRWPIARPFAIAYLGGFLFFKLRWLHRLEWQQEQATHLPSLFLFALWDRRIQGRPSTAYWFASTKLISPQKYSL